MVITHSRRTTQPYMALGLLVAGEAAVAIVAAMESSPYTPPLLPGGGAPEPLNALARGLGLTGLSPESAAILGVSVMVAASAGFLLALREAWRGTISGRMAVSLAVAFQVLAVAATGVNKRTRRVQLRDDRPDRRRLSRESVRRDSG